MYADPTLMDLAAAYAKRRNGRKTKHAVACDRPGAKAEMAQVSESAFVTDNGKKFNIVRWLDLSNASGAVQEVVKRAAIVADQNGKMWELKIRRDGSFVLQVPTAGGKRIEGKISSSRPGAKAKFSLQKNSEFMLGEYSVKLLSDLMNYMGDPKSKTAMVSYLASGQQATRGTIVVTHDGKQVSLYNPGGALIRSGAAKFSRPGAKANFATMDEVIKKYKDIARRVQNGENEQGSMAWLKDVAQAIRNKEYPPETIMRELKDIERAMGFSRPSAKSTHAALPPQTLEAERKPGGGSHSEAVSRKIATLINEGKPQDQAVAIALDLERRGEL